MCSFISATDSSTAKSCDTLRWREKPVGFRVLHRNPKEFRIVSNDPDIHCSLSSCISPRNPSSHRQGCPRSPSSCRQWGHSANSGEQMQFLPHVWSFHFKLSPLRLLSRSPRALSHLSIPQGMSRAGPYPSGSWTHLCSVPFCFSCCSKHFRSSPTD